MAFFTGTIDLWPVRAAEDTSKMLLPASHPRDTQVRQAKCHGITRLLGQCGQRSGGEPEDTLWGRKGSCRNSRMKSGYFNHFMATPGLIGKILCSNLQGVPSNPQTRKLTKLMAN